MFFKTKVRATARSVESGGNGHVEQTGTGTGTMTNDIRQMGKQNLVAFCGVFAMVLSTYGAGAIAATRTDSVVTPYGLASITVDQSEVSFSWHFRDSKGTHQLVIGVGELIGSDYARIELIEFNAPSKKVVDDGTGGGKGGVVDDGTGGRPIAPLPRQRRKTQNWGTLELLISPHGFQGVVTRNTAKSGDESLIIIDSLHRSNNVGSDLHLGREQ